MLSLRRRGFLGSLAMVAGSPATLQAQSAYPSRPIRIVHGYGPGSNPDVIARVVAPSLMNTLGQSVIVEPKPGAGERIAAQYMTTQPADGYTLYLITGGANVISATDPQVTFSTLRDFSYISTITLFPFALFVGEKSPIRTLKDLMAAARERPGKLNYGHAGTGNTLHLAVELLKSRTGIEIEPVAYKDQAQLISDVMNGRLDMSVSTFTNFHSALVNGQARAIAVTSLERWPPNPDVPPAADDVPNYEVVSWLGLAAPAGLAPDIARRLAEAVKVAVAVPDIQTRLRDMGNDARASTPDEFRTRVVADYDKWKPLSKIVYP
ncbi:MAG: tripartite tricarboxylate transporter substrate binding protein [Enhydrobacter sp.]|nr:tripartite tricarboxylate transporter substrate binding protein [Enhydrobacter sp.]